MKAWIRFKDGHEELRELGILPQVISVGKPVIHACDQADVWKITRTAMKLVWLGDLDVGPHVTYKILVEQ